MIVDFKEIPPANSSEGDQDQFELFARDFVDAIGYTVIDQPDRGQDGGRDLLISETLTGVRLGSERRWVLSAKHFAPSGGSVGVNDELSIRDRVEKHGADGFFGFYSTLPSSGLATTFKGLREKVAIDCLDSGLIQQYLITDPALDRVFRAYFPVSYLQFQSMGGYPATSKDLHTAFIGGDAYPYIGYGINSDGVVLPSLYNKGSFTLYDLDVIISYTAGRGGAYINRQSFPFLHPGGNLTCKTFKLEQVLDEGFMYSQIYARNGVFFQTTELAQYRSDNSTDTWFTGGSTQIHRERHDSKTRESIHNQQAGNPVWRDGVKFVRVDAGDKTRTGHNKRMESNG